MKEKSGYIRENKYATAENRQPVLRGKFTFNGVIHNIGLWANDDGSYYFKITEPPAGAPDTPRKDRMAGKTERASDEVPF